MTLRTRILFAVIPAMVVPFIGALFYIVILLGTPLGKMIFAATKGFTLVWPVVAMVAVERRPITPGLSNLSKHLRAIPLGLVSGAVIGGLIVGLFDWTPLGDYVRVHHEAVREKLMNLGLQSPAIYVIFGACLALFHSLLEEYFWRWYVFGRLSQFISEPPAIFLAGLAFALHHYVALGAYFPVWLVALLGTSVGVGGGFWCWLYRRQGTLVGAWVSHMLVDVAILYIGYKLIFLQ